MNPNDEDIEQIMADPKAQPDELKECVRLLQTELTAARSILFRGIPEMDCIRDYAAEGGASKLIGFYDAFKSCDEWMNEAHLYLERT